MHFESRKHILEYDDVANKQRKVIYAFRNDLLNPDYDIMSKLDENRLEYIQNLLMNAEIIDGMAAEDFDYDYIITKFKEELNLIVEKEDIVAEDYEALEQKLTSIIKEVYEEKNEYSCSRAKKVKLREYFTYKF